MQAFNMVKPTDFVAAYTNMPFYVLAVLLGGVFLAGLWFAVLFVSIFVA